MLVGFLLLGCVLMAGYGAGQLLLGGWTRGAAGRVVMSTFLGLLLLTFFYVALAAAGAASRPVLTIVIAAFAVAGLCRRSVMADAEWHWTTALAGVCVLGPTLLQGTMMAGGTYPAVFFNVDTAYYLQFVHSFVEHGEYPPPRLDNYGVEAGGYHYAVMALAALITVVTGIVPHTAFLLVVPMIGLCALIAAANELLKLLSVDPSWLRGAVLFTMLTGYLQISYPSIVCDSTIFSFDGLVCLASQSPGYIQLAAHPPHAMHYGTLFGFSICLLIMVVALSNVHRSHPHGYAAAVSLVPLVKTPYILFVATGIGGYSLAQFARSRNFKDLLIPCLAGAGMMGCFILFGAVGSVPGGGSWQFELRGTIKSADFFAAVFLAVATAFLLTVANAWRRIPGTLWKTLWFVIPLFLVGVTVGLDRRDADQLMAPVPFLVHAILLAVSVVAVRESRLWVGRVAGSAALFILLAVSLYSWSEYIRTLVVAPEEGYEFVDNRPLAEVLKEVPIEGTMLVTNDLRYPANDYERKNRQFQLTALYGHKAFNAEAVYSRGRQLSTEAGRRLLEEKRRLQKLLTRDHWDEKEIEAIIARYPITHLVIHRFYPHPERIPLKQVASSSRYEVYAFR